MRTTTTNFGALVAEGLAHGDLILVSEVASTEEEEILDAAVVTSPTGRTTVSIRTISEEAEGM